MDIQKLKVISLNINRRINSEILKILQIIKSEKIDICFLQETANISIKTKILLENHWEGSYTSNIQNKKRKGVTTIFGKNITSAIKGHDKIDKEGMIIKSKIMLDDKELNLINCYYPNNRTDQRNLTNLIIQNANEGDYIIGGDFNFVEEEIDVERKGIRNQKYTKIKYENFNELKHFLNISDVWRETYPTGREYTFKGNANMQSRIDRIYIANKFYKYKIKSSHVDINFSDHNAILCDIQIPKQIERGKGSWKLNTSLLDKKQNIEILKHYWEEWRENKIFMNPLEWWDKGKKLMATKLIYIGKNNKKGRDIKMNELKAKIKQLYRLKESGVDVEADVTETNDKIEEIRGEELEGIRIRAREEYILLFGRYPGSSQDRTSGCSTRGK